MNCEIGLHEGLIKLREIVCPFCKQPLEDEKPRESIENYYLCCDSQDIINDNGMIVCQNCGIVQGYKKARELIFMRISIELRGNLFTIESII